MTILNARILMLFLTAGFLAAAENERDRAWKALREHVQKPETLNHSRAVEAALRELAASRSYDAEEWGVAGLLHDIDITETSQDLSRHGLVGARILRELGFSRVVVHAVEAHDDRAGVARTSRLDHAVTCADQMYWWARKTLAATPGADLYRALAEVPTQRSLSQTRSECSEAGFSPTEALDATLVGLRKTGQGIR